MKVSLSPLGPAQAEVDALAIPVLAGRGAPEVSGLGSTAEVVAETIAKNEHRGRLFEVLPVRADGQARRLLLYGLGSEMDLDGQRLRWAHHELVRAARTYGYRRLGVLRTPPLDDELLAGIVEGCVMGTWEQRSRQTGPHERVELDELVLVGFGLDRDREVVTAHQLGEATNRTREWQNLPGNVLTPEALAEEARRIARRHDLEIEVLGPEELRAGGYNLVLAVAQGSAVPARLVRLRNRPPHMAARGETQDRMVLALVGKGITFDSGGISIKKAEGMDQMKADMAGAAAALSAFELIAARHLPVDVMCVLACSENMPSGTALKPGDVVTGAGGKTVEIVNTDAEGRLVLADAISHAIRHGATHIVDLATLTGAAEVAVGMGASIGVASDETLWAQVWQAAELAGDRVWRLPVYPDYRVLLQSRYADLKNGFYGQAGAIAGGMFIQEFTEGRPWVHLDIAASSWNTKSELTTIPRGPSGAGTRLCVRLAELLAAAAR